MSVIKMTAIGKSHAANAIRYALEKDRAQNPADRPVFLAANQVTVNDLTGKPTSPLEVWQDMEMKLATCGHDIDDPIWRIEFCPPPEECQNWTQDDWQRYLDNCIEALDTTNYREIPVTKDGKPVVDPETGRQKMKVVGQHTMLKNAPYVASIHFDTRKPHVHMVALRVTADNHVMSTHKYKERAKKAANKIAVKYGWAKAEDRPCQRMDRIHSAAVNVLKGMDRWDIETYFARLRMEGLEVDPRYDSQGVCRGYSVGEKVYAKDGTYSSTVMYKASAKGFGHGRDLTVANLYKTWLRHHPEKQQRQEVRPQRPQQPKPQAPVMPPRQAKEDPEYLRLLAIKEQREKGIREAEERAAAARTEKSQPTVAERERQSAISAGVKAISDLVYGRERHFSIHDVEDVLPPALAAKAIEMGDKISAWCNADALKSAADELVGMFEMSADQAATITEGVMAAAVDMVLPPVTVPSGPGGGGNNDLPKKKDDDWEWWKKNGFTSKQNRGVRR